MPKKIGPGKTNRLMLTLYESQYRELETKAVEESRSLQELVREAVTRYIIIERKHAKQEARLV